MTRVLLVEDNAADVELVREALAEAKLPHVLDVAIDFEEARNYIDNIGGRFPCPDVLLMDLNLPKGSGLDLLRILRAKPKHGDLPVIVVSSSNASSDRVRAAQLGVTHYFRKPADIDEFMKLGGLVNSIVNGTRKPALG
jgi:DNA-binding response OmpR family regulator